MAMMPTQQMQQPQPQPQGLLGNAGGLQNLAGNPLFNMGMGLLQHSYDPRINPYGAMMTGLQQAGEEQRTLEQQQREQQLREALEKYFSGNAPQDGGASRVGPITGGLQPQNEPFSDYFRLGWGDILNKRY